MALSSRYTYIQYTVHSSTRLECIPILITIKLNIFSMLIIDLIPHIQSTLSTSNCFNFVVLYMYDHDLI